MTKVSVVRCSSCDFFVDAEYIRNCPKNKFQSIVITNIVTSMQPRLKTFDECESRRFDGPWLNVWILVNISSLFVFYFRTSITSAAWRAHEEKLTETGELTMMMSRLWLLKTSVIVHVINYVFRLYLVCFDIAERWRRAEMSRFISSLNHQISYLHCSDEERSEREV